MAFANGRLKKEVAKLAKDPVDGIVCYPKDDTLTVLTAHIAGPVDTPYSGGNFSLELVIPEKYPFAPPKVNFTCKVYHPNIDEKGRTCLEVLNPNNWSPSITIEKLLQDLQCLLRTPNMKDPLVPEVADVYNSNPSKFKKTAQEWTTLYAKARPTQPCQDLDIW